MSKYETYACVFTVWMSFVPREVPNTQTGVSEELQLGNYEQ